MNNSLILAYWLEDAWVGFASAVLICLVVVVYRILKRVANILFHGRNAEGLETPWKPSDNFQIQSNQISDNKVLCKGCSKPLTKAQIDFMLGNPQYQEWCREGFCSFSCFEKSKSKDKKKD